MGIDENIYKLEKEGFVIEKDNDNYQVSFPEDKAQIWEDFIKHYLEVEYWNEYLAKDKVVFLFHLEEGYKRYEVIDFVNDEVLNLCEKLCDCKFESINVYTDQTVHTARRFSAWLPPIQCTLSGQQCIIIQVSLSLQLLAAIREALPG